MVSPDIVWPTGRRESPLLLARHSSSRTLAHLMLQQCRRSCECGYHDRVI